MEIPLSDEHDLIAVGYPAGPRLQELLKKSAALEARGITDPAYAWKLLKRGAAPPPKQGLHDEPAPLRCIMAGEAPSWREREEGLCPKQRRQIEHRSERRRVRHDLHDASDWNES